MLDFLIAQLPPAWMWGGLLRLVMAFLFGAIVGYERGSLHRPAGMRTHALVCMGSALVMLTGEFLLRHYQTGTDPARLGAQVVSGIGFLCAGTIMHQGLNVKGLTTAAGLWVVACIGLALGAGYWLGAALTTVLVVFAMVLLRKLENKRIKRREIVSLVIRARLSPSLLGTVSRVMEQNGILIQHLNTDDDPDEEITMLQIRVRLPVAVSPDAMVSKLTGIAGILDVNTVVEDE